MAQPAGENRMRSMSKNVGAELLLAASGGLAAAQTAPSAATVSQPSNAAVSSQLSDLPPARWAQSPADLKIVPPAKPLRPRGAGPGGAGPGDGTDPNPHGG